MPDKLITCRLHVLDASVRSVRMHLNDCCSDEDEVADAVVVADAFTTGDDDDEDKEDEDKESDVAL